MGCFSFVFFLINLSLLRLRKLSSNQVGYQQANTLWLNDLWIIRYTQPDLIILILRSKGFHINGVQSTIAGSCCRPSGFYFFKVLVIT